MGSALGSARRARWTRLRYDLARDPAEVVRLKGEHSQLAAIRSLKPKISREEAIARFCPRGIMGMFGGLARGPLRSVADVYVPFRLYRVAIQNAERSQDEWFALEAVCGSLDLYGFEQVPGPSEIVQVHTRNRLEPKLSESQAVEILREKVRRLIFQTGFFRIRNLRIAAQPISLELHIPYWAGFFGRADRIHVRMIDAVRGRAEGGRARQLLQDWLRE